MWVPETLNSSILHRFLMIRKAAGYSIRVPETLNSSVFFEWLLMVFRDLREPKLRFPGPKIRHISMIVDAL